MGLQRVNSLKKILMLGKLEGRRRGGRQRIRWLDGITDSMDMNLSKLGDSEGQGSLACCSPWGCKELDMTEQLNNNSFRNSPSPIPLTTHKILLYTHSSQVCFGTLTLCNADLVNAAVKVSPLPLPDIPAQPHHKSSKPVWLGFALHKWEVGLRVGSSVKHWRKSSYILLEN